MEITPAKDDPIYHELAEAERYMIPPQHVARGLAVYCPPGTWSVATVGWDGVAADDAMSTGSACGG